jgi:hypothetical protein
MKISRYTALAISAMCMGFVSAQTTLPFPLINVLAEYSEHASQGTLSGIDSARLKLEWEDATRWRTPQIAFNLGSTVTQNDSDQRFPRKPNRNNRAELLASVPIVNLEAKRNIDVTKATLESSIWAQSAELETALLDFANQLEIITAGRERKASVARLSANLERLFDALKTESAAGYSTPVARLELKVATLRLLRIKENAEFELHEAEQRVRSRLQSDAEYARASAALNQPRPQITQSASWLEKCTTAMTPNIAKVITDMDLIQQRIRRNVARYAPRITIDAALRDQKTILESGKSVLSGEISVNLAWQWLDSSLYRSLVKPSIEERQAAEKYLDELRTQQKIACNNNDLLFKRYTTEIAQNAVERNTAVELSELQTRRLKLGVQTTSLFELISNEFNAFDLQNQDIQTRLSLRRLEWEYMFQTRLIGVRNGKFFVG